MSLRPKKQNDQNIQKQGLSNLWPFPRFFENFSSAMPAIFEEISSSGLSVSSDEQNIYVEAQVPGLTANEVDVSIDANGTLWIKGEKKEEENDKKRKYLHRSQKTFSYCLSFGKEVDLSKEIKAVCKNGVMKLTFAKHQTTPISSKKIKVKSE